MGNARLSRRNRYADNHNSASCSRMLQCNLGQLAILAGLESGTHVLEILAARDHSELERLDRRANDGGERPDDEAA